MNKNSMKALSCEEISLYLKAVETMRGRSVKEPQLVTYSGKRLYPVYVDRVVKRERSFSGILRWRPLRSIPTAASPG